MTREEAIQVLRHIIQVADTSDCGIKEIDGIDEEALNMAIKALEQGLILDEIRAEIELLSNANPSYWHSGDMVEREEVFEIIDKYKAESDHKCHTCKHYMSGEYDGSCDSYICEHYSGWESEGKE